MRFVVFEFVVFLRAGLNLNLSYVLFVQVAAWAVTAEAEEGTSLPTPPPLPARRLARLPLSFSPAPDSEKTSVAARELPLGFSCVVV